jgi:Zn-dependent peptidase ImmA (M78 family)
VKQPSFPPLPTVVAGLAGPIRVLRSDKVRVGGAAAWGYWEKGKRLIVIDRRAPMRQQWVAFFHELQHAALDDTGIDNIVSKKVAEAICDAVSSARMRERFG